MSSPDLPFKANCFPRSQYTIPHTPATIDVFQHRVAMVTVKKLLCKLDHFFFSCSLLSLHASFAPSFTFCQSLPVAWFYVFLSSSFVLKVPYLCVNLNFTVNVTWKYTLYSSIAAFLNPLTKRRARVRVTDCSPFHVLFTFPSVH